MKGCLTGVSSAGLAQLLLTGCAPSGQGAGSTTSGPSTGWRLVLPATATPEEVVLAYLDALDQKDVDTAQHMLTARRACVLAGDSDSWFTNVKSITDVHVGTPRPEPLQGSAAQGYCHAVFVPVDFTLQQKHEDSMPNGPTVWGYVLVRNSDKERWLIVDEGPV
jgi:hypothetical protein